MVYILILSAQAKKTQMYFVKGIHTYFSANISSWAAVACIPLSAIQVTSIFYVSTQGRQKFCNSGIPYNCKGFYVKALNLSYFSSYTIWTNKKHCHYLQTFPFLCSQVAVITLVLGIFLWHFDAEHLEYTETNEALNLKNVLSLILNTSASIFKLNLLTSLSLIILLNRNVNEPQWHKKGKPY